MTNTSNSPNNEAPTPEELELLRKASAEITAELAKETNPGMRQYYQDLLARLRQGMAGDDPQGKIPALH